MKRPTRDDSKFGKLRDWLGFRIATFGLYVATPWYRGMIDGAIRLGLDTASNPEAYDQVVKAKKNDELLQETGTTSSEGKKART